MRTEVLELNAERNVTLTAYIQQNRGEFHYITARPGIIILPGGAYHSCSEREADPVAFAFLKAGYQVFILRYSIQDKAVWPAPLQDYEQAMDRILINAEKWGIDTKRIAVTGFSAGAHLAACAATMSEHRPAAAILGYPAVIGEDIQTVNKTLPDVIHAVDGKTCPCFVFATRDDHVVSIRNSIQFLGALEGQKISFESHIYAYGPHGFSTADPAAQGSEIQICSRAADWVEDSIAWLKDVMGTFSNQGMTEPVCKRTVTSEDDGPYLSVDCTIGHLMSVPQAGSIIDPIIKQMREHGSRENKERGEMAQTLGDQQKMISGMSLRGVLSYAGVTDEMLEQLNEKLQKIKQ